MVMVVGGFSSLAGPSRTAAPPASSHLTTALPPFTHGDLVVTNGETFVIQPTPGNHVYYQGGNITVDLGGTLIVRNVTLSFVQFVAVNGTAMERLSHIYHFVDKGTVNVYNSTLTTDVQVLNAYAKLNVTVEGAMTVWNSTLAFPGWFNVEGSAGDVTLNDSRVTGNPAVETLSEPATILGDTEYAPSISVTGGGELNAFGSSFNNTYADNTIANGHPQPVPLSLPTSPEKLAVGDNNFSSLFTPTDSANLTQDWLYPNADFQAGNLIGNYTNPNFKFDADEDAYVWFDGTRYFVQSIVFHNNSAGSFLLALPPALLSAITNDGVLNYLNWTGDFGVGPSRIAIDFDESSGPTVVNVSAEISLLPSPDFDLQVSGAGSTLNSINSAFDLNWNSLPVNATTQSTPIPWGSNKLSLTDGAVAYLANATISNPVPGVFSTSAVIPDATSKAFFYRWAQFNLTGRGGVIPIPNAQAVAYYAYNATETGNKTANALNDLATANPEIWGYVQYWDGLHGVSVYGTSNKDGKASLLLASANVTGATLPDGLFLGSYHIGIFVPATGVPNHWFNWTVSPYPEGVGQMPPALAGPDFAPPQTFPQYYGAVVIALATVYANGVPSTTINLGQKVGVKVEVEDAAAVAITQVSSELLYNASGRPSALLATYSNTTVDLTAPGQEFSFTLSWLATLNVTGVNAEFDHNFTVVLDWNHNNASLGGGNLSENLSVKFAPTEVSLASATVLANGIANTTVELGQTLGVQVVLHNVGNSTISSVVAWLAYNDSHLASAVLAEYTNESIDLTSPGQSATFLLSWKATENITGLHGWFAHNLTVLIEWNVNPSQTWLGQGNISPIVPMTFAPSQIRFTTFALPPTTINLGQSYISTGILEYNGSHAAVVELFATPLKNGVPNGAPIQIAGGSTLPGVFSIQWFSLGNVLAPGTSYQLTAYALYNSRGTNYTLPGTYSVPPTPSSPASFLFQTFLGLPIWAWLAIAAAAVVAIVLFLFVARRQAAGKLVECGECGNLIPEDATVCPKCGAEFESDLIRCSRCASTIPADSKFCPECAAQLLGTPGEAESDPEKQAYADFTEKYRAEAKRELGDNYSEGAFWDWGKRQPTYTPFSQWSLQQGQGTARAGMTAPPVGTQTTPSAPPAGTPPKGGSGWVEGTSAAAAPTATAPPPTAVPPPAAGGAGLKPCPNCGKEIPTEYLVCPFCNAVTQ